MHVPALKPSDIIIFGGTGDLSRRKIVPALYYRLKEGQLPDESRIILLGRGERDRSTFISFIRKACETFIKASDFDEASWNLLIERMFYHKLDASCEDDFAALKDHINGDARPVRVFYLATPADIYGSICEKLSSAGLKHDETRIVLEKPIGYGLASFSDINNSVLRYFDEHEIYRIDHYLGKETVQNLMVLRFTNNVFAQIWNGGMIDHVQISVAEDTGLEDRHAYYDDAGALRDMVQNHLLQLLCLIAMEPPNIVTADAIRDEKLKVLRALRPFDAETVVTDTVRGQYEAGTVGDRALNGYLEDIEGNISNTETFVAIKAHIDNWRWKNIPFYMRTGKAMKKRYSEIVIQFKSVAHNVFPNQENDMVNKLVIRLQPDEYVKFQMMTKVPGPGGYRFKPVNLNLSLTEEFDERYPDAYERLLMDVVRGNQTLFMRSDEVQSAWHWIETILDSWKQAEHHPVGYIAGSMGPDAADTLLTRDNKAWYQHEKHGTK